MRLIDAGLLLNNLSGKLRNSADYDIVLDTVNNTPTAYDVDKVVEQIDYLDDYMDNGDFATCHEILVIRKEVLEIIKAGGVS